MDATTGLPVESCNVRNHSFARGGERLHGELVLALNWVADFASHSAASAH
jgi:hypothetical protein